MKMQLKTEKQKISLYHIINKIAKDLIRQNKVDVKWMFSENWILFKTLFNQLINQSNLNTFVFLNIDRQTQIKIALIIKMFIYDFGINT